MVAIMYYYNYYYYLKGAGTALGELPPYFMARAAKLSGTEEDMDNDDIEEILEIEEKERDHPEQVKQMVSLYQM